MNTVPRTTNFWRTHRTRKHGEEREEKVEERPIRHLGTDSYMNGAQLAKFKKRITLAKVSIQQDKE